MLARPVPPSEAEARWPGRSRHIVGPAARGRPRVARGTRVHHPAARMVSIMAATSSISRRSSSSASSAATSAASTARRCSRAALSRIARRIASDLPSPVASSWASARRASSSRRTLMAEDTPTTVSRFVIRGWRDLLRRRCAGSCMARSVVDRLPGAGDCVWIMRLNWDLGVGAGEGNRTLMTSLEGWGSTIELRPHGGCTRVFGQDLHARSVPSPEHEPGRCRSTRATRPRAESGHLILGTAARGTGDDKLRLPIGM